MQRNNKVILITLIIVACLALIFIGTKNLYNDKSTEKYPSNVSEKFLYDLNWAISGNEVEAVRQMIKANPDKSLDYSPSRAKEVEFDDILLRYHTPLQEASLSGNIEILQLILAKTNNIDYDNAPRLFHYHNCFAQGLICLSHRCFRLL